MFSYERYCCLCLLLLNLNLPMCLHDILTMKHSITRLRIDSLPMKTMVCYSHLAVKTENLLEMMMLLSNHKLEDINPTIFAPYTSPTYFSKRKISHHFQENCGYIHNKKGTIPIVLSRIFIEDKIVCLQKPSLLLKCFICLVALRKF